MIVSALLISLCLITLAHAAPVTYLANRHDDAAAMLACLAVILCTFFVLGILVAFKHFFMARRRADPTFMSSASPRLSLSSAFESLRRSPGSVLLWMRKQTRKKGRQAFFVGFLGSPTWEIEKCVLKGSGSLKSSANSSWSFHAGSNSKTRSANKTNSDRSGSNEKTTVTEFGAYADPGFASRSSITPLYDLYNATGFASRSESTFYTARSRSTAASASRRHSLPESSVTRKPSVAKTPSSRRHSTKSTRSRKSDTSAPFPGLRMLDARRSVEVTAASSQGFEDQLPLSPASCYTNPSIRHSTTCLPPLPELPPIPKPSPLIKSPVPTPQPHKVISHPYALAPRQTRTTSEERSCEKGRISEEHARQIAINYVQSLSPVLLKTEYQCSPSSNQPVSPPPDEAPPPVPPASPDSPTLGSSPHLSPTTPAPVVSRTKPRRRPSSGRYKKSPPIGPSPLRIMTLPESASSATVKQLALDPGRVLDIHIDFERQCDENAHRRSYSEIGLGFPPPRTSTEISGSSESSGSDETAVPLTDDEDTPRPAFTNRFESYHTAATSKSVDDQDDDENVLSGIIQELVEETSRWDESLFGEMDDEFKSMIQSAGRLSEITSSDSDFAAAKKRGSRKLPPTKASEVDLGMHELDAKYLYVKSLQEDRDSAGRWSQYSEVGMAR